MSNGSAHITVDFCDERHGDLERRVGLAEKKLDKHSDCINKIKNRINIILILILLQVLGVNGVIPDLVKHLLK